MTSRHTPDVIRSDSVSINSDGKAVSAEEAYRVYVMTGMRSLRRTADLLGLPHGTVLSWSQRYGWSHRVRDTDLEVIEGAAEGVMMTVVGQALQTLESLARIRDDPEASPMARVEAGKALLKEYNVMMAAFGGQLGAERARMEQQSDEELEALIQTPEGVQVLLNRHRERTGRA